MVPPTKGNGPPKANDTLVGFYTHNALGQRVMKTVGSQSTTYLYGQGGLLIAEADERGQINRDGNTRCDAGSATSAG